MAVYTTQLRSIVEQIQRNNLSDPDDYSACYHYLGLDTYPIFDETYRSKLNDKIIRHFYFREIGFETAAQFAWYLRNQMNEQMPYYNQLYESERVVIDPITNRKYSWQEMYELAQGGSTTTDSTTGATSSKTVSEHTDDDLTHGHRVGEEYNYGKVETDVTDFGKTGSSTETLDSDRSNSVTDETAYGRTNANSSSTTYGSAQSTVNGGQDQITEGGTHERVIHSDTPMNQISNGGVESLNYASDVTYSDRSGTTASVNQYGGTTNVSNTGTDTTSGTSTDGGTDTRTITGNEARDDTKQTTTSEGGSQTDTKTLSGVDAKLESHTGVDQRDITTSITDSGTESGTGSSEFVRDLDESGTKSHNVSGYDGIAPADLLMRWRESFLNIDMQVIASLEVLFFGLWN